MTAQPSTPTELDWRVIESLDWDHEPPCEHSGHAAGMFGHAGPAYVFVRASCPGCPHEPATHLYLCRGAWERAYQLGIWHRECNTKGPRSDFWTIIGYVKGE